MMSSGRVRLFHGSDRSPEAFRDDLIGEGFEPNSALGIWLTASPELAADYARGGEILIVEARGLRLMAARDRQITIWAGDRMSDREISWQRFRECREKLMARGFDGIWCEMPGTDLETAVCLFSAQSLRITGRIPAPEDPSHWPDMPEPHLEDLDIDFNSDFEATLLACGPAREEGPDWPA